MYTREKGVRRLKQLLLASGVALVMLLLAADTILHAVTRYCLTMARDFAASHGVVLLNPEFDSVELSSPTSVTWYRMRSAFHFTGSDGINSGTIFIGSADVIKGRLASLFLDSMEIEVSGLGIHNGLLPDSGRRSDRSARADNIRFTADYIKLDIPVSLARPFETPRWALDRVRELLDGKAIPWPLVFRGRLSFEARGAPTEAHITAVQREAGTVLEMDRADVRLISERLGEDLSEGDIALISRYPLKAPRLFRIADRARAIAKAAHGRDSRVPEDAYRHVLWSFLLTRSFGPEMAETVSDSHEIGDSTNTSADHIMDYNNNRLGRELALLGMTEEDVLQKVLSDPAVIRRATLP